MYCPRCNSDTKVQNSRFDWNIVARRRKCNYCGYIFCTVEKVTENAHEEFRRLDKVYCIESKARKIRKLLDE